jgi:hypothetical protein
MVFTPSSSLLSSSSFDDSNIRHRLQFRYHRRLRDSFYITTANHSKQHYTYQYMSSYYDNGDSTTDATTGHSITTSVSIRVTPLENYFVSWGILWSAFVVASIVATWQVYREHRIFYLRRLAGKNTITATSQTNHANASSTSLLGSNTNNNSNNIGDTDDNNMNIGSSISNKQSVNVTAVGDGESVSSADLTRSMVRQIDTSTLGK